MKVLLISPNGDIPINDFKINGEKFSEFITYCDFLTPISSTYRNIRSVIPSCENYAVCFNGCDMQAIIDFMSEALYSSMTTGSRCIKMYNENEAIHFNEELQDLARAALVLHNGFSERFDQFMNAD